MDAPVTRTETFTILSKKVRKGNSPVTKNVAVSNFSYKIEVFIPNIHQPKNQDGTPMTYPILFALDGAAIFPTLCSMCTIVSNPRRLHPDMKPTAIVAVDYNTEVVAAEEDVEEEKKKEAAAEQEAAPLTAEEEKAKMMKKQFHQFQIDKRTKDFTPVPTHHSIENDAKFGGADDFHTFLADELIPLLKEKYGPLVSTEEKEEEKEDRILFDFNNMTLFGHSLAGLFTMHVFFHYPTTFHKYCAASPSLWFDDFRLVQELLAWEEAEKQKQAAVAEAEVGSEGEPPHYPAVVITYGTKENLGPSQRTKDEMEQLKAKFLACCYDQHKHYVATVEANKARAESGSTAPPQLVHPLWCFEHPGEHHIMNFFSTAPKAVVLGSSTSEEACKYLFNE